MTCVLLLQITVPPGTEFMMSVTPQTLHDRWKAARIHLTDPVSSDFVLLQITVPLGNEFMMGVTPQIMSRAVLDPMATYMEANVSSASL